MMDVKNFLMMNVKKLEDLGITIPKELDISEIIKGILNMPEEVIEAMEESQLTGMLLSHIGHGKYDFTDWSWSPLSDQVYSFDMEVFNTSSMYTIFLQGIQAITNNDLNITDVSEDCSKVDFEEGCGTQTVQFRCNSKSYQYNASANYDWFDTGMLSFMNQVVKEQNTGKSLYAASDGYQGCILFYQTKEWSEQFHELMGFSLDSLDP
ncbi:MAG: hypothetical protein HDQ98_14900 [Lachnospiraceae bacterium]|nr:hypothetical protein [Lachnospiraceae bacterium]